MDDGTAGDGQGTVDSGGSIFDPYISSVPEDAREYVTGYLKDAEKNVNSRLAEAADIQKQFGPYKEIDFSGYEPQQLRDVLAWHRSVTESPDAFNSWLAEAAKEAGLTAQEAQEAEYGELTPQQIQALVQEQAQSQIAPIQQQLQEFQKQQQMAGLERQIEKDFAAVEAEHKIQLTDEMKQAIVDLGESHDGEDFIQVGFKRLQALNGAAQADLVNSKVGQPRPSLSSGGQEAPSLPKDIKEIEAMARERFRQANAA